MNQENGDSNLPAFDETVFCAINVERSGVVAEFDEAAGLGAIIDDDGRRFDFHCTQIADGSRTIDTDAAVRFVLMRSNLGRIEATAIQRCSDR